MRATGSAVVLLATGVLAASSQVAARGPSPPAAAEHRALAVDVAFKPVTEEIVPLPPRRPGEQLYICTAEVRENGGPYYGSPRVLLFTGEEQGTTTEQRGVRVHLRASLDGDGQRARATVAVSRGSELLGVTEASFWLPVPPPRKGAQPAAAR